MMFCRICGKKMANSIKFCGNCGIKTNFVEKKKLAENKKKDVNAANKNPEPWQEVINNVPKKESIYPTTRTTKNIYKYLFF